MVPPALPLATSPPSPPRPASPHQRMTTPKNHLLFDPWNSLATGHQRADTSAGLAWRRTREDKLARQFGSLDGDCLSSHHGDGQRTKEEKGQWEWASSRRGEEKVEPGQRDIRGMFEKKTKPSSLISSSSPSSSLSSFPEKNNDTHPVQHHRSQLQPTTSTAPKKNLFAGTTIYLNAVRSSSSGSGSISDHHLRHLLTAHGATVVLGLSRRVTHVIVGSPNLSSTSRGGDGGAGGGLAAAKLQRDIARGGARCARVVGIEWATESIKAGKRLSEARFAINVAGSRQRSVLSYTA